MRSPSFAILLLLALPGCGGAPAPDAAARDATSSTPLAPADEERPEAADPGAITAIDAAAGDGRAMPPDSVGPSAYDLAQRAARAKEAERDARVAPPPAPAVAARLVTPANLLGGDEAVTAGD